MSDFNSTVATQLIDKIAYYKFYLSKELFSFSSLDKPISEIPFHTGIPLIDDWFYKFSLNGLTPMLFALTYFTSVHLMNNVVLKRQFGVVKANPTKYKEILSKKTLTEKDIKSLPAAPYQFSKTQLFKFFVILHNLFLCVYSVWTFIGMTSTIYTNYHELLPVAFTNLKDKIYQNLKDSNDYPYSQFFWQSICDIDNGIWYNKDSLKGLSFYSYIFYLSKFYEIIDTMIILAKGRQSSLLQSYHHSGAMLSMWAGVRYASPPIWIFVVFNSFIHSIMYFYFTLSTLKIKVPKMFKQVLTTMQIIQFVVGGSLAVCHLFVHYLDSITGTFKACIPSSAEALAIWINVIYLTPLTMLFAAFWVDSYSKKSKLINAAKKTN